MTENGLSAMLLTRPSLIIPYILRLTNVNLLREFMALEDNEQIDIDDVKSVFLLLALGCSLAALVHLTSGKALKKQKKTQKRNQKAETKVSRRRKHRLNISYINH